MEEHIKEFIQKYAEKERRSLTNFVTNAVLAYIKDRYNTEVKNPTQK
jgi:uncharacterized protein (DUF1778 family)